MQYADFAAWQRAQAATPTPQLAYWTGHARRRRPAGARRPTARGRRCRPPRGAFVRHRLDAGLADALDAAAARARALHARSWCCSPRIRRVLARHTGQDDVVVGTPIAGRDRPELRGAHRLFVNTLVLRTDLSGDPTFRELLARPGTTALAAYAHQDIPFERLVDGAAAWPATRAAPPLFQTMLILHTQDGADLDVLPGAHRGAVDDGFAQAKFDLMLDAWRGRPDGLQLSLDYRTDLFDAADRRPPDRPLRAAPAGRRRRPGPPAVRRGPDDLARNGPSR